MTVAPPSKLYGFPDTRPVCVVGEENCPDGSVQPGQIRSGSFEKWPGPDTADVGVGVGEVGFEAGSELGVILGERGCRAPCTCGLDSNFGTSTGA